jgi:hypothetical protein
MKGLSERKSIGQCFQTVDRHNNRKSIVQRRYPEIGMELAQEVVRHDGLAAEFQIPSTRFNFAE